MNSLIKQYRHLATLKCLYDRGMDAFVFSCEGQSTTVQYATPKQIATLFRLAQVKDTATQPRIARGKTYMEMVNSIIDGSDTINYIWSTDTKIFFDGCKKLSRAGLGAPVHEKVHYYETIAAKNISLKPSRNKNFMDLYLSIRPYIYLSNISAVDELFHYNKYGSIETSVASIISFSAQAKHWFTLTRNNTKCKAMLWISRDGAFWKLFLYFPPQEPVPSGEQFARLPVIDSKKYLMRLKRKNSQNTYKGENNMRIGLNNYQNLNVYREASTLPAIAKVAGAVSNPRITQVARQNTIYATVQTMGLPVKINAMRNVVAEVPDMQTAGAVLQTIYQQFGVKGSFMVTWEGKGKLYWSPDTPPDRAMALGYAKRAGLPPPNPRRYLEQYRDPYLGINY